jgi:hypothetical protein
MLKRISLKFPGLSFLGQAHKLYLPPAINFTSKQDPPKKFDNQGGKKDFKQQNNQKNFKSNDKKPIFVLQTPQKSFTPPKTLQKTFSDPSQQTFFDTFLDLCRHPITENYKFIGIGKNLRRNTNYDFNDIMIIAYCAKKANIHSEKLDQTLSEYLQASKEAL